jgi:hypothetical protein
MGDLNYRLEASRDLVDYVRGINTVVLSPFRRGDRLAGLRLQLLKKTELQELLARDQLLCQRKDKEAFDDFLEADIRFPPTYKVPFRADPGDRCRRPDHDRCPSLVAV